MGEIPVETMTSGLSAHTTDDSLKKRYLFKLFSNFSGLAISVVTQALIPRGLGPKAYGDFSYLTNFFNEILAFMDMGTSIAFYTKLSNRPKESGLVAFYLYFSTILLLAMWIFVAIASNTSWLRQLWPGQQSLYICMAAGWGVLNWLVMVMNKMTDAYGITVSAEVARVIQKVIGFLLIILIYFLGYLNLTNFFLFQYFIFILLGCAFAVILKKNGFLLNYRWRLSKESIKNYCREFYDYSHPLVVFAIVALATGLLDRWLLQVFAGSVQQGFFGLSSQIGALCFIFSGAMTPLITREFSIAFSKHDLGLMTSLFRRYIPFMYVIVAFISCFVATHSESIVNLIGGKGYSEAAAAVKIMAFYPLFQTYGQLSGSVFYATGQTRLYSKIGIFSNIIGPLITFLFVAPTSLCGMNGGATGLALKTLFIACIGVNIQLYFNTKLLNLSFFKFVIHQVLVIVTLLFLSFVAGIAIDLTNSNMGVIMRLAVSGTVYSILSAIFFYIWPKVIGLDRNTINIQLAGFVTKFSTYAGRT